MVKLVVISDTHTQEKKLPIIKADIVIHAGDFTYQGKSQEIKNFLDWYKEYPAEHRLLICGNHEETCDISHREYNLHCKDLILNCQDITYLENNEITIEGIKFYGTAWTPFFCRWGFGGKDIGGGEGARNLEDVYNEIPNDTEVLIAHGPPYKILDKNLENIYCGSKAMRKLLDSGKLSKLKLYLTGHIHENKGQLEVDGVKYINASSVDRDYNLYPDPITVVEF